MAPPLRVLLCITATRGCKPCTSVAEPDWSIPWCEVRYRSTVPIGLFGHINTCSLFQVKSPRLTVRNLPYVITTPTDIVLSGSTRDSSRGAKPAQAGLGLPPPASGVFSTWPLDVTTATVTLSNGILSPGFATVCLALVSISSYNFWNPGTCSFGSELGP